MIKVESDSQGRVLEIERNVAEVKGAHNGPVLLITCGLHGNEPSGVFAGHDFATDLRMHQNKLQGDVVVLAGNMKALKSKKRYIDVDLNRIWDDKPGPEHERLERDQLWSEIDSKLKEYPGRRLVHIDLHSTSSPSAPFIAMAESEQNRAFASSIPVPSITGLELVLKSPLLFKMTKLGYTSIAFEGGVIGHNSTYHNHMALLWCAVQQLGMLATDAVDFEHERALLDQQTALSGKVFDIAYVHQITDEDKFRMNPGFSNFEIIDKGEVLGHDVHGAVTAPMDGMLFMPLYQKWGSEGFYIII